VPPFPFIFFFLAREIVDDTHGVIARLRSAFIFRTLLPIHHPE
jgi:hypothetical protein